MIHLIDFGNNILRIHFTINYPSITKGMIDRYGELSQKIDREEDLTDKEQTDLQICKQFTHLPVIKFDCAEIISINSNVNNIFDYRMNKELNDFMDKFRSNKENLESIENIYYEGLG